MSMNNTSLTSSLDTKRISVFLLIAFLIAWLIALILYLNGGLANSPVIIKGTPITLSLVLLAGGYMFAPALANILTRAITREGWSNLYLKPNLKHGKMYWLAAWFLPGICTIAGGAIFFALFPQYFDPSFSILKKTIPPAALNVVPMSTLIALMLGQALVISPIINGIFTLGEEFGWRAYLLQKLLPLGKVKALIVLGVIWGVWHAPVIAMGHNYGLEYPGYPWSGILMMVVFCLAGGSMLGWAALEGNSVWPAVIGHGAMNGIAGSAVLFMIGKPNPLIGPLPVGIIGMSGYILFGIWVFFYYSRKDRQSSVPQVPYPSEEKTS